MIKKILSIVLILAMIISLAACAGGDDTLTQPDPSDPVTSENPEPETNEKQIELRTAWFGSVARHEKFNGIMDMFEKENPGIKVIREYSAWTEYFDKLNTQIASGNPPDVFQLTPLDLTKYASKDVLLDLQPLVDNKEIDLEFWDQKVIDIGSYDGVLNMITIGMSAPSTFINGDLVKRLGVPIPTNDMSWEQYKELILEIQSKMEPGQYAMFDSGGLFDLFVINILQKGKSISKDNDTKLGFEVDDVIAYLTWWDELRKAGAIPSAEVMSEEGSKPWEDSMMVHGNVAMQTTNANQLKIFQSYMEDKVDMLRVPKDPNGSSPYGEVFTGVFLTIPKTSKIPNEAAKLINYWVNDIEANKIYNFEHGILGSTKVTEALTPQLTEEDKKVIAHAEEVIKTAPGTTYRPAAFGSISTAFTAANDAIAFSKKTIEKAAEDFMIEAQKLLES